MDHYSSPLTPGFQPWNSVKWLWPESLDKTKIIPWVATERTAETGLIAYCFDYLPRSQSKRIHHYVVARSSFGDVFSGSSVEESMDSMSLWRGYGSPQGWVWDIFRAWWDSFNLGTGLAEIAESIELFKVVGHKPMARRTPQYQTFFGKQNYYYEAQTIKAYRIHSNYVQGSAQTSNHHCEGRSSEQQSLGKALIILGP